MMTLINYFSLFEGLVQEQKGEMQADSEAEHKQAQRQHHPDEFVEENFNERPDDHNEAQSEDNDVIE